MNQSPTSAGNEPWLHIVRQKIEGLRFGSVQIVIHEDRVTLVESTEKIRFPNATQELAKA